MSNPDWVSYLGFDLDDWVEAAFENSKAHGFHDPAMFGEHVLPTNWGEKIALMHSELSELLEAHRQDPSAPTDKADLDLTCEQEEVADVFLRLADYCGARGISLESVVAKKHTYNIGRPRKHGGRRF